MTVILSYRTPTFVFLAADSCRWDLVLNRNLGPVVKLHSPFAGSALAVGGQNIDRTEFARQMVSERQRGSSYFEAARAIAPKLFTDNLATQQKLGVVSPQKVISWYAECSDGTCELRVHEMPADHGYEVTGLKCMGPDSQWLFNYAMTCLNQAKSADGTVGWDAWAYSVVGAAAQRDPKFVGLPAIAMMLRADGTHTMRDDLHPKEWRGATAEFRARVL